jgi:hypothetical protein
MRNGLWVLVASALVGGGACATGLIADEDAGTDSSVLMDGAQNSDAGTKDTGTSDVIHPGDAGCMSPTVLCGTACVNEQTDPNHCGNCTTVCSAADAGDPGDAGTITAVCSSGTCQIECDGGLSQCGEQCFNENTDPNNCGNCGVGCDGGLCNQGSCCPPGNVICSGTCTDTTGDNNNCGSCGHVCDAGSCISSTCTVSTTYKVGNYTLFTGKSSHSPDFLLGSQLTLTKAAKLIDFGVISISTGQDVTMALYTDSGGAPDTLVAYTTSTALTGSDQQLAPNTNASLSAGNYWIMAVYNNTASVGYDTSITTAQVDYISFTYGGTLPTTFPTPTIYDGQRFNYYLVVE